MIDSPIFIVGAERSGSTLLRLMVDSHPDVTGAEGFEFLVDLVSDTGAFPSIEEYHDYLALHHIFGSSGLQIDPDLDYPSLVDSFLQQRLDASGKSEVSAMVHFGFSRLLYLWPNARFIHVLRDPRDVAKSVVEMGWHGNVWFGVEKWLQAESEWKRFTPQLSPARYLEVRFGELVRHNERTLRRVCQLMGVEYTSQMLDYAKDTAYALPDPQKLSQWRNNLSDREVQSVEGRVGDLMIDRGYELSGLPPLHPGRVGLIRLRAEDKIGMWRRRLETYGLRLFIERAIARLVPLPAYRNSVKLRYNTIERSGRKRSWRAPGREFSLRSDHEPTERSSRDK